MNKPLLIIGVIVLVLGIIAQIYSTTTENSYLFGLYKTSQTINPYSNFAIPLIVCGIILLVLGIVLGIHMYNKK